LPPAAVCVRPPGRGPHAGRNPCKREAKGEAKDCGAGCKETFQAAKDGCLDRDHACVEACRLTRVQCRLASGLDGLIDDCNDALEARRALCPAGDDDCIDGAQIDAFECRDAARDRKKPRLKECRRDFRTCAQEACGPASPAEPPAACIGAAIGAAKTCATNCKEGYQVAKDECRNLDHDCVELCRADRHTCRGLILDPALAVCAAALQLGVDGCEALHPPPRDIVAKIAFLLCVDPFQVNAFICRDDAHEIPGLVACQEAFRSCVIPACVISPPAP